MTGQNCSTRSSTFGSDDRVKPTIRGSPSWRGSRSPETTYAPSRSLQWTSRAETQILERHLALHPFAHGGKLPRREMLNGGVWALLLHFRCVSLDSAFDVRR